MWQSADPAFGKYLPSMGEEHLPGLGGAYNTLNLGLYGYGHLNPIKTSDPNGESATLIGAVVGGAIGAGIAVWRGEDLRHVAGAAAQGAIAGAIAGSVIDTGGASLGVIVAAGGLGNAAGGIVGRAISGDQQTAGAVVTDAAVGAAGALIGVGVGKVAGAVVDRLAAKPAAAQIIERTARAEVDKGTAHFISKMSPKEAAAYLADPAKGSRFLGTAAHRATRDALEQAHPGRFQYRGRGPDFLERATGKEIELTTSKSVAEHAARPGYGNAKIVTYD